MIAAKTANRDWLIKDFNYQYNNNYSNLIKYARVKEPIDELADIQDQSAKIIDDILLHLFNAVIKRDPKKIAIFTDRLENKFADTMALVDLIGRKRLLLEFDSMIKRKQFSVYAVAGLKSPVPKVPFRQAIDDIVSREPRLAEEVPGDLPLWRKVQEIYKGHAFALARSTSRIVTERVQEKIAKAVREGKQFKLDKETREGIRDFTKSYGDLVWRTNMNTAYVAGRLKQAKSPAVQDITPAFRYDTAGDIDVRDTHQELDGKIFVQGAPELDVASPPLHYNCRCTLSLIDRFQLKRQRRIRQDGAIRSDSLPAGWLERARDEGLFPKVFGNAAKQIYGS